VIIKNRPVGRRFRGRRARHQDLTQAVSIRHVEVGENAQPLPLHVWRKKAGGLHELRERSTLSGRALSGVAQLLLAPPAELALAWPAENPLAFDAETPTA